MECGKFMIVLFSDSLANISTSTTYFKVQQDLNLISLFAFERQISASGC
jgi:hypothetical protein